MTLNLNNDDIICSGVQNSAECAITTSQFGSCWDKKFLSGGTGDKSIPIVSVPTILVQLALMLDRPTIIRISGW